jgi:peptidyl-prolyl cis-trans isomerase C
MTRFSLALAASLMLPFAAQAQDAETPSAEAPAETPVALPAEVSTVLATVNGKDITLGHVLDIRRNLPQQYQNLPPEVLLNGILEQVIDQMLLADAAEAKGAAESASFKAVIENQRRSQLANLEVLEIAEAAVTEEALVAAHAAATAGMTQTSEFNASHILVETEEEAAALITQLADGADFAALAQEHSTGPSGPRGGALGWFGPGQMVPAFDSAVQALEIGEVSAPVQTQFGWHVVLLNDTRDTPLPTLDEMRQELSGQIQQEALSAAVTALRDAAEISRPEGALDPSALNTVELFE